MHLTIAQPLIILIPSKIFYFLLRVAASGDDGGWGGGQGGGGGGGEGNLRYHQNTQKFKLDALSVWTGPCPQYHVYAPSQIKSIAS